MIKLSCSVYPEGKGKDKPYARIKDFELGSLNDVKAEFTTDEWDAIAVSAVKVKVQNGKLRHTMEKLLDAGELAIIHPDLKPTDAGIAEAAELNHAAVIEALEADGDLSVKTLMTVPKAESTVTTKQRDSLVKSCLDIVRNNPTGAEAMLARKMLNDAGYTNEQIDRALKLETVS
jgi:hypothetical protein